jgi:hypothetical protein
MSAEEPITLKEVQLRLGVPQHVLIHLCEKGVIEPDFAETSGRGKRREFSQRNLFEFAVALALRRFELSVATTALIVRVVRSLVKAIGRASPGFELLDALLGRKVDLRLHLYEGDLLVLAAGGEGLQRPLLLGAHIGDPSSPPRAPVRVSKLSEVPATFEARLELDLSEIALKTLKKGLPK